MLKLRYCKLPHRSKAQKGKIIVETSVSGVSVFQVFQVFQGVSLAG